MKNIIVTGCNGQLGRAINRALADQEEYKLVNTDVPELDITDIDKVMALAKEVKPYAIINCAAHTNVNACETDGDNAFRINAIGPRNLSIAARETGAKVFQISTDYVFSGNTDSHYKEYDAVHPMSVYGKTKLLGEELVKEFGSRYFILRTAWMYGEGKNFVRTMLALSEKSDKVQVVNDQFGTPTYSMELAKAIAYLLPTDNYGTFHATCEGECSWAEFAKEIFRLAGKATVVEGITTDAYDKKFPGQAHRPAYSVLDNYMLDMTTDFKFAPWEAAIAEYMKTL
ncbi:MAG: dTDP-4-dehydrorhamnose reductase [Lachnospiraceae bacterium]|nr:dTDP-4-dehydrorhamnose reductase [Lachnospiraceae bacterium]